jgi:hypothetical protein
MNYSTRIRCGFVELTSSNVAAVRLLSRNPLITISNDVGRVKSDLIFIFLARAHLFVGAVAPYGFELSVLV